jgi:hypothetical protein
VDLPNLLDRWGRPVTSCLIAADPRTRQDREAEHARAAQAENDGVDLKLLRAIATLSPLTSKDQLQLAAGIRKAAVIASVARLVARGWLEVPKQRQPFTLTPSGKQAIATS